MTVVERIFELLELNKMTAKDLSKAVGLSGGNITDWKTGRSKPSVTSLNKIANYFNVSIDYLLGNADKFSYEETLIRYLKPLNLTETQFNIFLKICVSFINKEPYQRIAEIIKEENVTENDFDKIFNAFQIFADLADEFEKTTKLNKITYTISKTKNFEKKPISPDNYDYLIENIQTGDVVKNGLLSALNNLNKSLIISNTNISSFYMCPVYGQISAGQPNWVEENIEGRLPLDSDLMGIVNPEEHFFLRVNGESMNKIIKNGSFALIHKQDVVENGEIAVVLVNGFDATLKKFTKQGELVILEPQSSDDTFKTQVYDKTTSIKILGKYVGKMEINK